MCKLFYLFTVSLIIVLMPVQAFGWERAYGDGTARCVQETSDGGYIAAGTKTFSIESWTPWVLKLDSSGDTVWTRMYFDETPGGAYCIHPTSGGGYVITGDVSISEKKDDLWVIKTDSAGNTLWTRIYGGEEKDRGHCVVETKDGGYIVTGETYSFGFFPGLISSLWVLKLDAEGDSVWSRVYPQVYPGDIGGEGYCVSETDDGGYILTGTVTDTIGKWLWLVRTDAQGDTLWTQRYGGKGNEGRCVRQTPGGGYIIAGTYKHSQSYDSTDVWLLRTDSLGDTLWTRKWSGEEKGGGYSVDLTSDGGYVLTGEEWGSLCLIKVDSSGSTEWERNYWGGPGGNRGYYVEETSDKGYIIAGCQFWALTGKFWLIKTDSLGHSGIEEPPVTPVTHPVTPVTHFNSVGREIILRYSDSPQGFHASVFDASGRRLDELHSTERSGMIVWGECYGPGVYFIVPDGSKGNPLKVVLIK